MAQDVTVGRGRGREGGGVMSDLCPHVLCLLSSCDHIWSFSVSCSLLVQLVPAVFLDYVPGVSVSSVYL